MGSYRGLVLLGGGGGGGGGGGVSKAYSDTLPVVRLQEAYLLHILLLHFPMIDLVDQETSCNERKKPGDLKSMSPG